MITIAQIEEILKQVLRESERHQARMAQFQMILSLLVGWLLSIFATPATLLSLFHH